MASAWGQSWGAAWGNSWGVIATEQPVLSIGGPDEDDEKPRIDDNQIIMMVIKEFLSKQ